MRSIFAKVYAGMLVVIFVIAVVLVFGTYYVNQHRFVQHVQNNYGGTFDLISAGVARHQGEPRQQWLAAIERISGLKFELRDLESWPVSAAATDKLLLGEFAFQANFSMNGGELLLPVTNTKQYYATNISDLGSALVRISAFLMLNEIGRQPKEQRLATLDLLRATFRFPIELQSLSSLHVSPSTVRSIRKGDISVILTNSVNNSPALMAYAPLGNSPYALVIGGIPFFDRFPAALMVSLLVIILVLMAAAAFMLVRPLERRLALVDEQIDRIGHDKEMLMTHPSGDDAISKLSSTVNNMAARIHGLIDGQTEMVRAISHELRTPITRIRFRLAALDESNDLELQAINQGVTKDLSELENLIDEVLTFSKLKRQSPLLSLQSFDLTLMLEQLIEQLNSVQCNHKISFHCPANTIVVADEKFLKRAVSNLLANAQRYAVQNIELSYQKIDGEHRILINDDGCGIPESARQQLFEPFKRLDTSRNRQSGGYGLGLAIVKQIAIWHQGNVEIADSKLGGAQLLFCWPSDLVLAASSQPDRVR